MDLAVLQALYTLTGHGADRLFVLCASYLQYILGGFVLWRTIFPRRRIHLAVAAFGAALIARLAIAPLIQIFVSRARPFVILHDIVPLISLRAWEWYRSMPSGHTIFFFALATASYRYDRTLGRVLFVGATIIGVSRIIIGVHWPSDILIGAILGSVVGWAFVQLVPSLRSRISA